MPRNYKIISVCWQQLHQGQEKKKLNAFMQRKCLRMQKKDISKQNFFSSALINGLCSKTSTGSCFLKVLREKREGKDGTAGMRHAWLKRKTISPSFQFFIKLLEMQWEKQIYSSWIWSRSWCLQFCCRVFYKSLYKDFPVLTLENVHLISTKFSEFIKNKKCELHKNEIQINL